MYNLCVGALLEFPSDYPASPPQYTLCVPLKNSHPHPHSQQQSHLHPDEQSDPYGDEDAEKLHLMLSAVLQYFTKHWTPRFLIGMANILLNPAKAIPTPAHWAIGLLSSLQQHSESSVYLSIGCNFDYSEHGLASHAISRNQTTQEYFYQQFPKTIQHIWHTQSSSSTLHLILVSPTPKKQWILPGFTADNGWEKRSRSTRGWGDMVSYRRWKPLRAATEKTNHNNPHPSHQHQLEDDDDRQWDLLGLHESEPAATNTNKAEKDMKVDDEKKTLSELPSMDSPAFVRDVDSESQIPSARVLLVNQEFDMLSCESMGLLQKVAAYVARTQRVQLDKVQVETEHMVNGNENNNQKNPLSSSSSPLSPPQVSTSTPISIVTSSSSFSSSSVPASQCPISSTQSQFRSRFFLSEFLTEVAGRSTRVLGVRTVFLNTLSKRIHAPTHVKDPCVQSTIPTGEIRGGNFDDFDFLKHPTTLASLVHLAGFGLGAADVGFSDILEVFRNSRTSHVRFLPLEYLIAREERCLKAFELFLIRRWQRFCLCALALRACLTDVEANVVPLKPEEQDMARTYLPAACIVSQYLGSV